MKSKKQVTKFFVKVGHSSFTDKHQRKKHQPALIEPLTGSALYSVRTANAVRGQLIQNMLPVKRNYCTAFHEATSQLVQTVSDNACGTNTLFKLVVTQAARRQSPQDHRDASNRCWPSESPSQSGEVSGLWIIRNALLRATIQRAPCAATSGTGDKASWRNAIASSVASCCSSQPARRPATFACCGR